MPLSEAGRARRHEAAVSVAREAGALALAFFRDRATLAIESKGPHDLVSRADRAVEALIRERLGAAFPDDRIVGEEEGGEPGAHHWYVDPIDGTQNFLHGLPQFVVSLAFVEDGRTMAGAIHDPNTGETFAARRGHGATCDGRPMRVSAVAAIGDAVIGVGHTPRHAPERYLEPLAAVIRAGAQTRNLCCAALQLAWVADGRIDATWDPYLLAWDVAAGLLMVEEAGGAAQPFVPGRGGPHADALLAGTRPLVAALQAIGAGRPDPR